MTLVRKLVLHMLRFNINFRAQCINTKSNAITDSTSRCQCNRFWALALHADPAQTSVPFQYIADLIVETNIPLKASVGENTWQTYEAAIENFNHFRYLFSVCNFDMI